MSLGEACSQAGGDIQTGPFGSQLHASDYVTAGVPSIMPQNIGDNRVNVTGIAQITPEDADRLARYKVRTGDIVYSRRGDVERRALIRETEDGWLCGTGCLRIRFENTSIDPQYASYYLGHKTVREWIVRHAQGATMLNLNTAILSALPFVVPPKKDQRAIASILGSLDDKIELNRRTCETLEEMARAIFKSWFVDFDPVHAKMAGEKPEAICARLGLTREILDLFPNNLVDSELGEIPEGWMPATLNDFAKLSTDALSPFEYPNEYFDHYSIPAYDLDRLPAKDRGQDIKSNKYVVIRNSVLVSKLNPETPRVWLPIVGESRAVCSTEFMQFVPNNQKQRVFLYGLLTSSPVQDAILCRATGSTGSRQRAQPMNVATMCVMKPHSDTILAYCMRIAPLLDEAEKKRTEGHLLANIRDTLLHKLISGEVVISIEGKADNSIRRAAR